jgi:hypothetical protein
MTVAFANANSIVTNDFAGNGGNHTVAPPASIAAGDLWLILAVADQNNAMGEPDLPSGWAKYYGRRVDGGADDWPQGIAFWKIAGASESNVTFAYEYGAYQVHSLSARFTGTHQTAPLGTPVETQYYNASTGLTAHDPTDITIQNAGAMLIEHVWAQKIGGSVSAPSVSSDLTQLYTRGGGATGIYDKGAAGYLARNAGSYSPNDVTFDNTGCQRIGVTLFEILPPASGGVSSVRVDRARAYARGLGRGF